MNNLTAVIGFSAIAILLIVFNISADERPIDKNGYNLYSELTNNTLSGIWIGNSVIIIPLSNKNINELNRTLHHEYLHHLINSNYKGCGNESCKDHFCG